ncbi:MAG: protein kinase [Nocardioides sp.]|uniref:protein kinase domain-containing protein n=1 Tax=Nocardioides sp. TaxID=35761 RepID=UPI003F0474DE
MNPAPREGDAFGRYHVEQQLGAGGMGVVHLALDTKLQRRVALKVVSGQLADDNDFLTRFHREAEILTQLDSPHVITIFEHGEISGVAYLAMQYVAGGDLGSLLRARGPLPAQLAAAICAQVAAALEDAHRAGIIHRDVKPANVLLRDPDATEPFAYLSDFGIAKSNRPDAAGDGLTQLGNVAGSWAYLAPERTRGEPASRASDIYALGCLFYACLTGHAPYVGSDVEIALAHVNEPVPHLAGGDPLSNRINDVLSKALAKEPTARHASAEELRQDLLSIAALVGKDPVIVVPADDHTQVRGPQAMGVAAGSPPPEAGAVAPAPATPAPSAPARKNRLGLVLGGAAAALVLVAGGTWLALTLGDDKAEADKDTVGALSGLEPVKDPVRGDWNNDGHGDVRLTGFFFGDGIELLPQQSFTANSDATAFEGPVEDLGLIGDAYAGDVDGDGRLDLVELKESEDEKTQHVTIYPGGEDALGDPVKQTLRWNTDTTTEATPGMGDFDGDGRDDLLLPGHRGDNYMVLAVALSNGKGFDAPQEFGYRAGNRDNTSDRLGIGDFNGDGKADVFSMADNRNKGMRFRVLLSDGEKFTGTRVQRIEDGTLSTYFSSVVAADVDGDGATELVSVQYMKMDGDEAGHGIKVTEWTNGAFGTPQVWQEPTRAIEGVEGPNVTVVDVDGDGLEDLVQVTGEDKEAGTYELLWHRSTGTAFEDPVVLATPPCLQEGCTEALMPVSRIP